MLIIIKNKNTLSTNVAPNQWQLWQHPLFLSNSAAQNKR